MSCYTATPHLLSICHPAIRSGVEKMSQCCVRIRGTLGTKPVAKVLRLQTVQTVQSGKGEGGGGMGTHPPLHP